jgi:hypothetical protein
LHSRLGAVIEDTKSVALDAGEIIEIPPAVVTLSATGEAIAPMHAPYMTDAVGAGWELLCNLNSVPSRFCVSRVTLNSFFIFRDGL